VRDENARIAATYTIGGDKALIQNGKHIFVFYGS
jgi:hypothetical protein